MGTGGIRVDDAIVERLGKVEEYVRVLESLRGRDFRDPVNRGALERYLQIAAEATLDAGEMIISRAGLRRPESYRDVIRVLTEAGILAREFGERFEGIGGLRNVLVHGYATIDVSALESNLSRLNDFRSFAQAIARYLASR